METILYHGGPVHPGPAGSPLWEAVAVRDGSFLACGTLDEVRSTAEAVPGPVRYVDLQGATMIPGLIESHVHLAPTGLTRTMMDLRPAAAPTIGRLLERISDWLAGHHGALPDVVQGWGYDDTAMAEHRHPHRVELDAVSGSIPIVLMHSSAHLCVANSAALALAGVTDDGPERGAAPLDRDPSGRLTGLLREQQMFPVLGIVPKPDVEDISRAILDVLHDAAARGMTCVHDLALGLMAGPKELDAIRSLAGANQLPVRVRGFVSMLALGNLLDEEPNLFAGPEIGLLKLAGAKLVADGSIQGLTAALLQPYHCRPDSCGELVMDPEELAAQLYRIEEAGGQAAIHANGDRAIAAVLEAMDSVAGHGGRLRKRHRIEHFQTAHSDHVARAARLGAGVSIFANHVYFWGDRHRELFLGPERAARISPCADAVRERLPFGLHSDTPVTPMDALTTMWTAVSRRTSSGYLLGREQSLTAAEALQAMTVNSAWLTGEEHRLGRIAPGFAADAALLDRNPVSSEPDDIRNARVLGTIVNGTMAYDAGHFG
jgi:predicted amidohydrolase YtcJ